MCGTRSNKRPGFSENLKNIFSDVLIGCKVQVEVDGVVQAAENVGLQIKVSDMNTLVDS